jgi:signal transduction histidine kinase
VLSVDTHMVERIIDNLIGNAVRHNPGGVHVRVGVRSAPGGAEIVVADDGKGVPAEPGDDLFKPFTSGRDASNDPSPGLGLGLAIVKQIAELHGGRVWHQVTPGGGATFGVFLPREDH